MRHWRWLLGCCTDDHGPVTVGSSVTCDVDVMDGDGVWWWATIVGQKWSSEGRDYIRVHFYGWDDRWDMRLAPDSPSIRERHTFSRVWGYQYLEAWCHYLPQSHVELRIEDKWYNARIVRVAYHTGTIRVRVIRVPLEKSMPTMPTMIDAVPFECDVPWDTESVSPPGYHCQWPFVSTTGPHKSPRHAARCSTQYKKCCTVVLSASDCYRRRLVYLDISTSGKHTLGLLPPPSTLI